MFLRGLNKQKVMSSFKLINYQIHLGELLKINANHSQSHNGSRIDSGFGGFCLIAVAYSRI